MLIMQYLKTRGYASYEYNNSLIADSNHNQSQATNYSTDQDEVSAPSVNKSMMQPPRFT